MEVLSRRVFVAVSALAVVALLAMTVVSIPMAYAHHPENPPKPSIQKSDEFGDFGEGLFETYMEGITDVSDNEVIVQADGVSYYGSYTWNEWYDINFDGDVDNDSDTWSDANGDGYVDEGEYTDTNGDGYYSDEWYDWNGNGIQDSDTYNYNYFEASAGGEYCDYYYDECFDYPPTGSLSMTVDGLSGLSFDVDSLFGSMYQLGGINVLYYYVYNSDWSDWSEHDGGVIIAQVVTGDDLATAAEGDEEDNLDDISSKDSPGDLLNIKGILYAGDAAAFYAVQYGWCPQFDEYGYYLPADQCDWEEALSDLQNQAIWDETFSGNDKADNYFLGASEDDPQAEELTLGLHGMGTATAKINKVNTNFDLHVYVNVPYTCNSDGTMELADDEEVTGELHVNDEVIDIEEAKLTLQEKKITLDVKKDGLSSNSKDTLKVTWAGNFDCGDDDDGVDVDLAAGKVIITAKVTTDDTANKLASLNSKKTGTGEIDYNGEITA